MVLLKSPSPQPTDQPFLLIEKTPIEKLTKETIVYTPSHGAGVGYARMCLLVPNATNEARRLSTQYGYSPLVPPVTDRPGSAPSSHPFVTIFALRDPDGNMVEFVSMDGGMIAAGVKLAHFMGVMKSPVWVHVNINVTNFERSFATYETLRFQTEVDYGRVVNRLYRALNISDPGVAKQVSLIKLPGTEFCIDLIEWEDPATLPDDTDKSMSSLSIAITVKDAPFTIDRIIDKEGWSLLSPPSIVTYPSPLGRGIHASISDPDGVPISLVSFPTNFDIFKKTSDNKNETASSIAAPTGDDHAAVLITGCDSGFGRSAACHLAALGFHVIAACYTPSGAQYLSNVVGTSVVADLTTTTGVDDVIAAVQSACRHDQQQQQRRKLWGIVNNAGMAHPGHAEWISPSAYEKVMSLNFHAPVTLIHNLLPLLKDGARGDDGGDDDDDDVDRIVNVTSVCGIVSAPSNSTYSASKFALEAYSDAIRVELAPYGIKVIVLEPTTMATPLGHGWGNLWKANYDDADAMKKRDCCYSEDWAAAYHEETNRLLLMVSEDPMIVVEEMVEALMMPVERVRVLCGEGAKAYRYISLMKESERDGILDYCNKLLKTHPSN